VCVYVCMCVYVQVAREQAARLLDESTRLVDLARNKIDGWDTLDALLLFKSAQQKFSRADVICTNVYM